MTTIYQQLDDYRDGVERLNASIKALKDNVKRLRTDFSLTEDERKRLEDRVRELQARLDLVNVALSGQVPPGFVVSVLDKIANINQALVMARLETASVRALADGRGPIPIGIIIRFIRLFHARKGEVHQKSENKQ